MIKLSYTDVITGENYEIEAEISYEPLYSSYGIPALLTNDKPLDLVSWVLHRYRVISVDTEQEAKDIKKWLDHAMSLLSTQIQKPKVYTTAEIAEKLGISEQRVRQLVVRAHYRGLIDGKKGNRWLLTENEINRLRN